MSNVKHIYCCYCNTCTVLLAIQILINMGFRVTIMCGETLLSKCDIRFQT